MQLFLKSKGEILTSIDHQLGINILFMLCYLFQCNRDNLIHIISEKS